MTEHTPGPWTVDIPEAVCVRSEDGSRLCTINWLRGRHGLKGRIPDEEGMANARLLAAAPDLLEFAKRMYAQHGYEHAAHLIAKAEGRQP